MKHIKTHLPIVNIASKGKIHLSMGALLSPLYWIVSHFYSVPGLNLHYQAFTLGLRLLFSGNKSRKLASAMIISPMDSVRYFEFDFVWKAISSRPSIGDHLDISSPRLFTILLLDKFSDHKVVMVNPDKKDLYLSMKTILACGFSNRCQFHNQPITGLNLSTCSFDTITSISVLEHIPMDEDLESIKNIWDLLKTGGRLLISVPCARESYEEFIDSNEYGLLVPDKDNFVFGQRFYDENLLADRIFTVTGRPIHYSIYGEKSPGIFFADREEKNSGRAYPFWKEPYMMGRNYRDYNSINELPGLGVIAMEFVKS